MKDLKTNRISETKNHIRIRSLIVLKYEAQKQKSLLEASWTPADDAAPDDKSTG